LGTLRLPLILMIIISLIAAFANVVGVYVGPIEYQGTLTYVYVEGEDPIGFVAFTFDDYIADSLLVVESPSGWTHTQAGNVISLSGGPIYPGDSLVIEISAWKYVLPGSYLFTVSGGGATARGELFVTEMILLKIIWLLNDYLIPLMVFTGLLGLGELYSTLRKPKVAEPVPPGTVTEEPPITPPIVPTMAPNMCALSYEWMFQAMDLNVWPTGRIRTLSDDPLPLRAHAYDRHALIHHCTCPKSEASSTKAYIVFANVRYEWEIVQGADGALGGGFISQTDGRESQTDQGPMTIFLPPEIKTTEEEKTVTIKVTAHHDDATKPPSHEPMELYINMKIRRDVDERGRTEIDRSTNEIMDPGDVRDELVYEITIQKQPVAGNPLPPEILAECIPEKAWEPGSGIEGSVTGPLSEVAYGDYVKLVASATDDDVMVLRCLPSGANCIREATGNLTLNDTLVYRWSAEKGSFPRGNHGENVIWQAPDEEGPVRITVEIRDSGSQHVDDKKEFNLTINVRKLGIDLLKTPKPWLPTATAGVLPALAKTYLCIDGKWRAPGRKKHVRFKLKKVSREKGVCMNYPRERDAGENPDLFFYEERMETEYLFRWDKTFDDKCPTEILVAGDNPEHEHHYLYSILKERKHEATPVLRCEDYGAVARLEAMANHAVPIPPREEPQDEHKDCGEGPNDITAPRDENSNDIADSSRQDDSGAAPNKDDDRQPVADTNGDGLTNYEEYRGFVIGGKRDVRIRILGRTRTLNLGNDKTHIRTNVKKKDVFIYDEDFMGTGLLGATNLDIHILYLEDLFNTTRSREINFNHGRHHGGTQHGLWLREFTQAGLYGMSCAVSMAEPNGPPRVKTHVCINKRLCNGRREPANRLAGVIAHELCHGLNIWHHGEGLNHNCSDGTWNLSANRVNGVQSGDTTCLMRYDRYALSWCHGTPHHVHHYVRITPLEGGRGRVAWLDNPGTTLCTTTNGTGLNNAGAGHINNANAGRGNCRSHLKVKDW